jgi:hypothetical protein
MCVCKEKRLSAFNTPASKIKIKILQLKKDELICVTNTMFKTVSKNIAIF